MYIGEYSPSVKEHEVVAGEDTEVFSDDEVPAENENETESLHQQSEHQQSEQLMVHAEVYLLAKYLDITELMRHAASTFTAAARRDFRVDAFLEPFSRVFENGGDGDSGLRAQILELCLENSEHLPEDGELSLLLLEHEPIAWKMLSRQAHSHAGEMKEFVETQQALEETVQTSQETIETLERRIEGMTTERDRMLALLEKYERCRNCEKEFGSYVDKYEPGIMRCKSCRCRHYP